MRVARRASLGQHGFERVTAERVHEVLVVPLPRALLAAPGFTERGTALCTSPWW